MKLVLKFIAPACCLVALVLFTGCQPEATTSEKEAEHGHGHDHGHEHDHSDRPQSLREAIVELKELSDSFCAAMDEDNTEAAHDPLHHLGKLLDAMPELAADTDLPEDQWKQVKDQVDQLFDAFGTVDATFHEKDGDKKAAYEDVKQTIEEGIAALEASLPLLPHKSPHADHAHSHDEDSHDEDSHDEDSHDEDSHDEDSHDEDSHDEDSHDEDSHDEDSHDEDSHDEDSHDEDSHDEE